MNAWRTRFEQMERWRNSPSPIKLSRPGTSFASADKALKRLQETMKPLLDDLLVFDASDLQCLENPLLTESQRGYLSAFHSKP
jgi:hypothetical protein